VAQLIVLRGNSGVGKSAVARELRAVFGRGVAIVRFFQPPSDLQAADQRFQVTYMCGMSS
jgi:uridine kinase